MTLDDDKWNTRHLALARLIAQSSKDPKRQVGAIIVDYQRRLVGSGYNGFPRGVRDHPERYEDKYVKNKLVVHAEVNAVLNATRRSLVECAIYSTRMPCSDCAKVIIQSGLSAVVCPKLTGASLEDTEDASFARLMLCEASVELIELP